MYGNYDNRKFMIIIYYNDRRVTPHLINSRN